MQKTSAISARIDPVLKQNAEQIFHNLGLTASQAIAIFYRQVELKQGLPFPIELLPPQAPDTRASRGMQYQPAGDTSVAMRERSVELDDWDALQQLLAACQVETGISDLAEQHDHYLYGKPKQSPC